MLRRRATAVPAPPASIVDSHRRCVNVAFSAISLFSYRCGLSSDLLPPVYPFGRPVSVFACAGFLASLMTPLCARLRLDSRLSVEKPGVGARKKSAKQRQALEANEAYFSHKLSARNSPHQPEGPKRELSFIAPDTGAKPSSIPKPKSPRPTGKKPKSALPKSAAPKSAVPKSAAPKNLASPTPSPNRFHRLKSFEK